jgi:hypothetical protein
MVVGVDQTVGGHVPADHGIRTTGVLAHPSTRPIPARLRHATASRHGNSRQPVSRSFAARARAREPGHPVRFSAYCRALAGRSLEQENGGSIGRPVVDDPHDGGDAPPEIAARSRMPGPAALRPSFRI